MTAGQIGTPALRLGIDLGGTKIAGVALGPRRHRRWPSTACRRRATTMPPRVARHRRNGARARADGGATTRQHRHRHAGLGVARKRARAERQLDLAQRPAVPRDLEAHLGRPVRLANDANCFALSEAVDGAASRRALVFGVILGTGCGGGLVFDGALIDGPRGIGGEWGHNPLPWAAADEHPGPRAGAAASGCMETWVSGPGLRGRSCAGARASSGSAEDIAARAAGGDAAARGKPRSPRQPARPRARRTSSTSSTRRHRAGRRPLAAARTSTRCCRT